MTLKTPRFLTSVPPCSCWRWARRIVCFSPETGHPSKAIVRRLKKSGLADIKCPTFEAVFGPRSTPNFNVALIFCRQLRRQQLAEFRMGLHQALVIQKTLLPSCWRGVLASRKYLVTGAT